MSLETKADLSTIIAEKKITCPKCETLNDADARYCLSCGLTLMEKGKTIVYEDKCIFAEGLPDWSIEPPQVVVRRKHR